MGAADKRAEGRQIRLKLRGQSDMPVRSPFQSLLGHKNRKGDGPQDLRATGTSSPTHPNSIPQDLKLTSLGLEMQMGQGENKLCLWLQNVFEEFLPLPET